MPDFDDEPLEDEEVEIPEEEDDLEELYVDERGHVRLRSKRRQHEEDDEFGYNDE